MNANVTKPHPAALTRSFLIGFAAIGFFTLLISPENAQASGVSTVFCDVIDWVNGGIGVGISTLAVIILGIGAMLGKVSWGLAMTVAAGIALAYNAEAIMFAVAPNFSSSC